MDLPVIKTIQNVAGIGCERPQMWFRGHSRCYGKLVPRVFRGDYLKSWPLSNGSEDSEYEDFGGYPEKRPDWGGLKRHEAEFVEDFVRYAPAVAKDLPPPGDKAAWLVLMQHHGLPTRLLDWTESALVALYFVVSEDKEDDGGHCQVSVCRARLGPNRWPISGLFRRTPPQTKQGRSAPVISGSWLAAADGARP